MPQIPDYPRCLNNFPRGRVLQMKDAIILYGQVIYFKLFPCLGNDALLNILKSKT